jgi:hypothetical protein
MMLLELRRGHLTRVRICSCIPSLLRVVLSYMFPPLANILGEIILFSVTLTAEMCRRFRGSHSLSFVRES